MDCHATAHEIDGATLVSVLVENPHEEGARFRLANELDGPVHPPRRRGHPEAGYDEAGYEGVLEPGERAALGYSVPAPSADPPATIAWTEPAETTERRPDAAAVARRFRDPRPPRSVVSPIDGVGSHCSTDGERP